MPRIAAPIATSCFGWLSSASGRRKAADSISLTSGIRDDPPTSTIADTSAALTPAESSTRCMAATVSSIAGRNMSSNSPRVSRTDRLTPGSATATTVSTLNDSTSFASTQSRRRRASAVAVAGSASSSVATSSPSAVRTWRNTASSKSIPPRCSTPSGGPSSRNPAPSRTSTAASKVPPPRSYTAIRSPSSTRSRDAYAMAAASGSVQVLVPVPRRPAISIA